MEFLQAIKSIILDNNIALGDSEADKKILIYYKNYCETDDDILQFQQYKNILTNNIKIGNEIYQSYMSSKLKGDHHYKDLADKIEYLADELEKHYISCFSYSYFIYAFIDYFINDCKDISLKKLGITPIHWVNACNFDLSNNYDVNQELTFGFGRYKENLKSYKISNNNTLEKYLGKAPYVIIPNFVNKINAAAFKGNKSLRSIYIPESVLKLEKDVFNGCENLETVIFGGNISILPSGCFEGCKRLKRINLDQIKEIGDSCFKDCTSLCDVNFKSLKSIGNKSFEYCIGIQNFDFISNLINIGDNAFKCCTMTFVNLDKCQTLGNSSFENCNNIRRITINNEIKSLGNTAFLNCINVNYLRIESEFNYRIHTLFSEDIDTFNSKYINLKCIKKSNLISNDFSNYSKIEDIEILHSNRIPNNAFLNCTQLQNVKFDNKIDYIGQSAFENCILLSTLEINYTGDTLKSKTFYKCTNLKNFNFLSNVVNFEEKALAYDDLSCFSFNRNFRNIGSFAFANSIFPKTLSLNLGNANLNPGCFHGIKELKSLKIESLNNVFQNKLFFVFDKSLEEFNSNCKINYLFIKDEISNSAFENYKNIRYVEFEVNSSSKSIPDRAFKNSNFESIKANGEVSKIGKSTFENCSKLISLDMTYQNLNVLDRAFYNCTNAQQLVNLNQIIYFGNESFVSTNIQDLILSQNVQYIGKNAFSNCLNINNVTLPFVGDSLNSSSQISQYLGYIFSNIEQSNSNVQCIKSNGSNIKFYIPKSIKKITILSSSLKNNFADGFEGALDILLPNISKIKTNDFGGYYNLNSIYIGSKLETIEPFALSNCHKLIKLVIDDQCLNYCSENNNILSKNKKKLYFLSFGNDFNNLLGSVEEIASGAVIVSPSNLELKGNLKLESRAINGNSIVNLSIDNLINSEEKAIYNCDNIKCLSINGSFKDNILVTNDSKISLNELKIDSNDSKYISSVFSDDINISVSNLEIRESYLNSDYFNRIDYIKNAVINQRIDNKSILLFANTNVYSLSIKSSDIPLYQLFNNNVDSLKQVYIQKGSLLEDMFNGLSLQELRMDCTDSIETHAFNNSFIENVYIKELKNIENSCAFENSEITNFEIEKEGKYKVIDSNLYDGNTLMYIFNRFILKLIIPPFVTHIQKGAIDSLTNLEDLVILNPDTFFETGAISNCDNLITLRLSGIKNDTLGEVFSIKNNLQNIYFNGNTIKPNFFKDINKLKNIYCDNLITIKEKAFAGCTNLKIINLNKTTYIGDLAFIGCKKLLDVKLDSVMHIGDLAFYDNKSLQTCRINKLCKYIGLSAFEKCNNLNYLELPIPENHYTCGYKVCDILGTSNYPQLLVFADNIPDEYFNGYLGKIEIVGKPTKVGKHAFKSVNDLLLDFSAVEIIDEYAFSQTSIKSLNLPNVITIGNNAFEHCDKLIEINLNSVMHVGDYAFYNNESLQQCKINKLCKYIGLSAFEKCNNLNYLEFPISENHYTYGYKAYDILGASNYPQLLVFADNIPDIYFNGYLGKIEIVGKPKKIGKYAFKLVDDLLLDFSAIEVIDECAFSQTNLELLNLPKIITIGNNAFENCDNLKSVSIGKDIKNIGSNFLYNCPISNLNINSKNTNYETINNCLINKLNGNRLEYVAQENEIKNITFNDKVEILGTNSISNSNIESLSLVGIKEIEPSAISSNINLSELHIENCQLIKGPFIKDCPNLTTIVLDKVDVNGETGLSSLFVDHLIPDVLNNISITKEISNNLFDKNAFGLNYVSIPNDCKKIPDNFFVNCPKLKEFSLPTSCDEIGKNAFNGCKCISNLDLTKIKKFGEKAFYGCNKLKDIDIPFVGSTINAPKPLSYLFDADCNIRSLSIHSGNITEECFIGFDSLVKISLPIGIKKLYNNQFKNLVNLETIENNETIEEYGDSAFENCVNLDSINVTNAKSFGKDLFKGCNSLKTLELPFIGQTIKKPTKLSFIMNPEIQIDELNVLDGQIIEGCFENFINIEKLVLPEKITKILPNTFKGMINLKSISNIERFLSIGKSAFEDCHNLEFYNYLSLDNLEEIEEFAFKNCNKIQAVILSEKIHYIGKNFFEGCLNITDIALPFKDDVKRLKDILDEKCKLLSNVYVIYGKLLNDSFSNFKIENIVLNDKINAITESMFENNISLISLTGKGINKIENNAFKGCKKLKTIDLSKVISFGSNAFMDCDSLTNVTLSNDLLVIPSGLFASSGLKEINIPLKLKEIHSKAFLGTKMKDLDLYFPKTLERVDEYIFKDALSPIIHITKSLKPKETWDKNWNSGCLGHGLFKLLHKVKIKIEKD